MKIGEVNVTVRELRTAYAALNRALANAVRDNSICAEDYDAIRNLRIRVGKIRSRCETRIENT